MAENILFTRRNTLIAAGASIIGGLIGVLPGCTRNGLASNSSPDASVDRILKSKLFRAGYGGFRPYTIANSADPSKPTGFLVDVFSEIVSRMQPVPKIQWTLSTFDTLLADMNSGKIDVFADAIYETVPRAQEFLFTKPFGYFGVGVALIRRGDNRFHALADLDREGVTIALAEGWTSTDFARANFHHAHLMILPTGDDGFVPLNAVVAGRADAALQDVPTISQYVAANNEKVTAIGLDAPPARVAAAFIVPKSSRDLVDFLNVSLDVIRADGTLARIAGKWKLYNEFPVQQYSTAPGD